MCVSTHRLDRIDRIVDGLSIYRAINSTEKEFVQAHSRLNDDSAAHKGLAIETRGRKGRRVFRMELYKTVCFARANELLYWSHT
jgi:hypothetical protein